MQWLSSPGPTKVEWNLSRPWFLLYSNISADGNLLWDNWTQRSSDWDIKNQSGSDSSSLSSEALSVYGHKERKTPKERERQREKSSLCMRYNKKGSSYWGLKPPVVRSVHFSTGGGTHCLLCTHWMAHMKNTHPCRITLKHTFQHKHAVELGLMNLQTPRQQIWPKKKKKNPTLISINKKHRSHTDCKMDFPPKKPQILLEKL